MSSSKTNNIIGFSILGFIVIRIAIALIFGKTEAGVGAADTTSTLGFILAGLFYAITVGLVVWGIKNGKRVSLPSWYTLTFVIGAILGTLFLLDIIHV